ncbi:hypothetical protein FNAPI_8362 [Fusarium napiforme]|uniref:Uncharacterized protein n=1 Tax=Fusarium napiforme TaxID=42672 RepID=A0A8H5N0V0_9HYPO|nr:hypothetical protein FNAPI_8362 [Fusarium napiforme]
MLAPGRDFQRHRNYKNRGRVFVIAMVMIFLVFNCRNLDIKNASSPSHLLASSHRISRLHYLVPANVVNRQVCAVVTSALANRYSIPTILGYRAEFFLDAQKTHIAKLHAIQNYLHNAGLASDDLVIIVDGFDVLAQLPAELMIQRYFILMAEADQRLTDQRGITVKELHRTGYSDSRFLNSGTVIGPLDDLHKFIDAALSLIEDDSDQNFLFRDSDQFYIAALYARQEYQRMRDLNRGDFPEDIAGRDVPRPKGGKDNVTEYHVAVDFDYTFTQTECDNYKFIHKLQYDNFDMTATIKHDALEEGSSFRPYKIQMPAAIYQALHRVYHSLPAEDRPAMSGHNWIRSLRIGTNIGTRMIFAFYHNTCDKAGFVDTFHDAWFYPLIRPLLRTAVRAIQNGHPISSEPIDGRLRVAARQYPKRDLDEYGGVFTDAPGEKLVPLQEFCSDDIESAIGGDTDDPLTGL